MAEEHDDKRGVNVDAWKLYCEAYSALFPNHGMALVLSSAVLQEMVDRMLVTGGVIYQALASAPYKAARSAMGEWRPATRERLPNPDDYEATDFKVLGWLPNADSQEVVPAIAVRRWVLDHDPIVGALWMPRKVYVLNVPDRYAFRDQSLIVAIHAGLAAAGFPKNAVDSYTKAKS